MWKSGNGETAGTSSLLLFIRKIIAHAQDIDFFSKVYVRIGGALASDIDSYRRLCNHGYTSHRAKYKISLASMSATDKYVHWSGQYPVPNVGGVGWLAPGGSPFQNGPRLGPSQTCASCHHRRGFRRNEYVLGIHRLKSSRDIDVTRWRMGGWADGRMGGWADGRAINRVPHPSVSLSNPILGVGGGGVLQAHSQECRTQTSETMTGGR